MVGYEDSYYKILIDLELSRVFTLKDDLDQAGKCVEKGMAAIKAKPGGENSPYLVDAYLAHIE